MASVGGAGVIVEGVGDGFDDGVGVNVMIEVVTETGTGVEDVDEIDVLVDRLMVTDDITTSVAGIGNFDKREENISSRSPSFVAVVVNVVVCFVSDASVAVMVMVTIDGSKADADVALSTGENVVEEIVVETVTSVSAGGNMAAAFFALLRRTMATAIPTTKEMTMKRTASVRQT